MCPQISAYQPTLFIMQDATSQTIVTQTAAINMTVTPHNSSTTTDQKTAVD
jgi:hypothetical protein